MTEVGYFRVYGSQVLIIDYNQVEIHIDPQRIDTYLSHADSGLKARTKNEPERVNTRAQLKNQLDPARHYSSGGEGGAVRSCRQLFNPASFPAGFSPFASWAWPSGVPKS